MVVVFGAMFDDGKSNARFPGFRTSAAYAFDVRNQRRCSKDSSTLDAQCCCSNRFWDSLYFNKIAPEDGRYRHEETWHDDNGHAHVRATLLGPSLTVPVIDGNPTLGTWQQVVLIDFDTRPRSREVVVQVVGE